MNRIKKGDEVIVVAGKDKGRRGTVLEIGENERVLVEGINIAKKHLKANPNQGIEGGIVDRAMPIHISNIAVFNPKTKKADRIGVRFTKEGAKERFFRSNGDAVDI
ncbi:MAG: 50S ribosomal protein L24 [Gammaproteobacteria bacterium]|nr:50S ribosomal protein L24 [Gammaproteobacteria bacterium]